MATPQKQQESLEKAYRRWSTGINSVEAPDTGNAPREPKFNIVKQPDPVVFPRRMIASEMLQKYKEKHGGRGPRPRSGKQIFQEAKDTGNLPGVDWHDAGHRGWTTKQYRHERWKDMDSNEHKDVSFTRHRHVSGRERIEAFQGGQHIGSYDSANTGQAKLGTGAFFRQIQQKMGIRSSAAALPGGDKLAAQKKALYEQKKAGAGTRDIDQQNLRVNGQTTPREPVPSGAASRPPVGKEAIASRPAIQARPSQHNPTGAAPSPHPTGAPAMGDLRGRMPGVQRPTPAGPKLDLAGGPQLVFKVGGESTVSPPKPKKKTSAQTSLQLSLQTS